MRPPQNVKNKSIASSPIDLFFEPLVSQKMAIAFFSRSSQVISLIAFLRYPCRLVRPGSAFPFPCDYCFWLEALSGQLIWFCCSSVYVYRLSCMSLHWLCLLPIYCRRHRYEIDSSASIHSPKLKRTYITLPAFCTR